LADAKSRHITKQHDQIFGKRPDCVVFLAKN
jgi:hypothetical protein